MGNKLAAARARRGSQPGFKPLIQKKELKKGEFDWKETGRYHDNRAFEEDYILEDDGEKILGSGYNGIVRVCINKVSGERCALKTFSKLNDCVRVLGKGKADEHAEQLRTECEIYLHLDHPNVARLLAVYEDGQNIYFVMELCSGGELYSRLIEKKQYVEEDAAE
eukprot:gene255-95_t